MKLYTEEQMRKCYSGVAQNVGTCIKQSDLPTTDEYINSLTPIELPSDEEILEQSIKRMEEWYGSGSEIEIDAHNSGAKWMKQQILNQNK